MTTQTTLLIVDDSTENLKLLGNSLKNAGYNVLAALNGKQALALALSKQPDLVLLDVMMPEMNGFEVCEALKENNLTRKIPVIFLTASIEIESIKTGFEAGGIDYIAKPFNPDELLLRVNNHLSQKADKDALEKELRYKSSVLHSIGQGITEPLSVLFKNVDLLSQNFPPESFKTNLQHIQSCGNIILNLTNNLKDLTDTESSFVKAYPQNYNLNEVLDHVRDTFNVSENEPHPELNITIEDTLTSQYSGDHRKLRQAIINLINTQLKYIKNGSIAINVNLKEKQGTTDLLGIDISVVEKESEKQFSDHVNFSGNDIGIFIARELLRVLDGNITYKILPGTNPAFSIELPLQRTIKRERKEGHLHENPEHLMFDKKNILVVEDNELNQRLMSSVLQSYGAAIVIAQNGKEALEKILESTYDVILMDVNIPLISGIEVSRVIRTQYGILTPIIGISGHSDKAYIKKCMDSGMNSFLLKPFDICDLQAILLHELEKTEYYPAAGEPVAQTRLPEAFKTDKYCLDTIIELASGNKELITKWTNSFKIVIARGRHEIDLILKANEYTVENKVFHELNNYTSYFGVALLKEYLKDLPRIHESSPKEELMNHFKLIGEELACIEDYFKELADIPKATN